MNDTTNNEVIISREIERNGNTELFYFREMTGLETESIFFGRKDGENKGLRANVVSKGVCNQDGTPRFNKDQAGNLKNWQLDKLSKIVLEINGLDGKDDEEAKNE
jgi:hypothetical protein